ncbi:hypothetical protein [Chitinimonas naiadis]
MSDYLILQTALRDATAHLLMLAREEAWDELQLALPAQKAAFAALQSAPAGLAALPATLQLDLRKLITETESANQELLLRLAAWQREVSTILKEIDMTRSNGKKISRAYGA